MNQGIRNLTREHERRGEETAQNLGPTAILTAQAREVKAQLRRRLGFSGSNSVDSLAKGGEEIAHSAGFGRAG